MAEHPALVPLPQSERLDDYAEGTTYQDNATIANATDFEDILHLIIDDPNDLRRPWKTIPFFYLYITTYVITLFFGIMGNVAVIVLMAGDRKSRNTTNMFLVSLSMADLLMLVLCVPLETVYFFVVLWDSGGAACKMANYFMTLSFTASVLNLTAVSLERFIVIVFPMRSRSLCTMSNCRRSVLFVWLISLLLACPVFWVMELDTVNYTNSSRTVWFTAYYCKRMSSLVFLTYQLLVLFVVPAILMIVFYTVVIRELWRSTKNIKALTNANRSVSSGAESYYLKVTGGDALGAGRPMGAVGVRNGRMGGGDSAYNSSASLYVPYTATRSRTPSPGGRVKRHREKGEDVKKARKQVIKMLIVVVVLFLLCWGPKLVMQMCITLGLRQFNQVFYNFNIVFVLLPFIHCCINPIIYCFMSKNFRRSMKRMFGSPWRSCQRRGCCPTRRPPPANLLNRVVTRSIYSSYSPEGTSRHTDLETVSTM
ncbi:allatostatin-A receptor-like [Penaeus japonicus]|uniref:allatostatin-A receptor-like n=1 Tax=Penaeus japonicus TaxID=27405 RepID=UPI001C710CDC|nr:allatostatin-A receptor-like [Penaeus japonicus]